MVVLRADRSVAVRMVKPAFADGLGAMLADRARHPERTFLALDGMYVAFAPVRAEVPAARPTGAHAGGTLVGYVVQRA